MANATPAKKPARFSLLPKTQLDWLLLIAFVACIVYPLREHFAGGIMTPSLGAIDMHNKVVLITGANTGIGFETAQQLARQNATVIVAGRSSSRINAAADAIKAAYAHADVHPMILDLASLESVRTFAKAFNAKFKRLDVLINNAGVMFPPFSRTTDGFEMTFGTNHLGHFLLTGLLVDKLKASAPSRIIAVSSRAHERGHIDFEDLNYNKGGQEAYGELGFAAYSQSKLANVLHAQELARRLKGTGVAAVSLHPGVVRTELLRHWPTFAAIFEKVMAPIAWVFTKSSWEGAQTTLQTALSDDIYNNNGAYYADCTVKVSPNAEAHDAAIAARLWTESEKLVGMKVL